MKGVIAASCWTRKSSFFRTNQTANRYRTTRENLSTVMNKGVKMRYKAVTANLLTVVGLLVEPSKAIKKMSSLEASLSIRQPTITVISSSPFISPPLSRSLFFSSMLISNSRSHQSIGQRWSTVDSYVGNISDLCGRRSRNWKIEVHGK